MALSVTRTAIEASRFLNFCLLKILDRGSDIHKMDQMFFCRAFILIAGVTRKENSFGIFGATLHEYDRQRPAGLERFDPAMITQVLIEAGRDYLTPFSGLCRPQHGLPGTKGVSVTVSVPKLSRREKGEEEEACFDIVEKRIITVDPSSRDIITCVSYMEEGEKRTWQYINKGYKEKIGAEKVWKLRLTWQKKAQVEE